MPARNSIGIMLVSGMVIGTAFTPLVVPSIYMLVAREHRALVPVGETEPEPLGEVVAAPVPVTVTA